MITRREFIKLSAASAAALYASTYGRYLLDVFAFSQSDQLKKFIQPLRKVGDIPVAMPDTGYRGWWQPGVTHYTIDIGDFTDQLHPDLPNPTRLRGFGQNGIFKHLGGIIAAKRGEPVQITFRNKLSGTHPLPIDRTIDGADLGDNRVDVHLHGGYVPWISDGGPHAWWSPDGTHGPSFINNSVLNKSAAKDEAEFYYPNNQGARLVWYHDHVFSLTRLNAYAGIASGYVIYDDYELSLVANNNLPGPLDPRTVYLVFQDKIFVSQNIAATDPTWPTIMPNSRPGDLWYAHVYDTARYDPLDSAPAGPPLDPSVVPEFFGDTMLVNGTVYPVLEVEQRQYRFRLLNACQARFLNPRLVYAQGSTFPANTEPKPTASGPAFIQIGTEGGFLPASAMVNGPKQPLLLLAPAERADVIVDFRDVPDGSTLILYNDAPGPFPMGDARNDYYPNNPKTATIPGYGPNTRTQLQIKVKARSGAADPPITLPATFTPTDPFLVTQTPGVPTPVPNGVPIRYLTLNEDSDEHGRLIQFLGTDQPVNPGDDPFDFGRGYMDSVTEMIPAGSTEVWEIINLTGDTHPIHFHLVNVQVLSRQAFYASRYAGGQPGYKGSAFAPDQNELGWKETVRMNPGEVTRVLMKFDLPVVPFTVPASPRLQNQYGINGAEYVWHCHILEHEEHDMMRALVVF